jgi:hypothetical protein
LGWRLERGDEQLVDIGAEAQAVDRSIENAWSNEPVVSERPEKGQRPPMAMRRKAPDAFALAAPAP